MTVYAFPGAVADVVTATKIESTWGDAIRDRVIGNHATKAAADAAIAARANPAKVEGMAIYSAADHALLIHAGATDLWQMPWNLPWGLVGLASSTASQVSITTLVDLTSLTLSPTAVANRRWKISLVGSGAQVTNAGAPGVTIATGASGAGTQLTQQTAKGNVASDNVVFHAVAFATTTAGSNPFHARGFSSAAELRTLASATNPWQFFIEDVGPNGAPS